uniref:Uncharacterized protein MANES_15G053200 n=1 Tax=Rhizophora mucronata TaxID=61149 RepID=A0A2P2LFM6_RHIMU
MFSRSISTKNLSFVSQRRRLIPYEPILIPFRALFSTHMVGDRPMLVRDFIHSALYDAKHGYFSQLSRSVGVLERSIRFNQLEGTCFDSLLSSFFNYLFPVRCLNIFLVLFMAYFCLLILMHKMLLL